MIKREVYEAAIFETIKKGATIISKDVKAAFEKALQLDVFVPPYYHVMGALGAAYLSRSAVKKKKATAFRGFTISNLDYKTGSFECKGCPNICEIITISLQGELLARWGSRCGKWDNLDCSESPAQGVHV